MHPRRPRTRGHSSRGALNPPPPFPSPPQSPSPPSSPPPSLPVREQARGNEVDLGQVLAQFTRTVTTALHWSCNLEGADIVRVMELGAKEFFGSVDPVEAEAWLIDIERIFEVLQCPDGDRVRLATFLLKGNAYHWWKAAKRNYTNTAAVTWEEFQRVFFEQFYPPSYKNAKKSEFMYLKQGSMSVLEYEHKFNELSRFAPELVATEEERCRRFEEGLWLDIQVVVTATTYPNMRALAQAADRVVKKFSMGAGRRRKDAWGFGGPSQGPSKKGGSSSSSAGSGWSGGRGSSSGRGRSGSWPAWSQYSGQQSMASTIRVPSRQTSATCHNCGQVGHFVRDCPNFTRGGGQNQGSSLTCYACGQVGHTRRNCSTILQKGTSDHGIGAQQGQGSIGQSQSQSGASSSAARSSSSSGVQSSFKGRGGRHQKGQPRRPTTHARVFSMTQQEAQATPYVTTGSQAAHTQQAGPSPDQAAWDYLQ